MNTFIFPVSVVFENVWRKDLTAQGYYLVDCGVVDSKTLRSLMLQAKEELSKHVPFGFRSAARFDQQETTKFHQDGGPDHNMLMLGYEPSKVKSQLFIADHACAANDLQVSPAQLVTEAMLDNLKNVTEYITQLHEPIPDHSYILFINNSKDLGVLHKATIDTPDPKERRIINSVMLVPGPDELSSEAIQDFLTTDDKWKNATNLSH